MTPDLAEALALDAPEGALVSQVVEDSAAEAAGLAGVMFTGGNLENTVAKLLAERGIVL